MTKFSEIHPETKNRRVHEFLIWRAGQSVRWNCTQVEIAKETGLSRTAVSNICKARGWTVQGEFDKGGTHTAAVDSVVRSSDAHYRRAWT